MNKQVIKATINDEMARLLEERRKEMLVTVIRMQQELRKQQRQAREYEAYAPLSYLMAQEDILDRVREELGLNDE